MTRPALEFAPLKLPVRIVAFLIETGHGQVPYVPSTIVVRDAGGLLASLGEWDLETTWRGDLGHNIEAIQACPDEWKVLWSPYEWKPDHVVLVSMAGDATYGTIDQVEKALNFFVDFWREQGHKLVNDTHAYISKEARAWFFDRANWCFDLARRVSNEVDDYVRVWWTAKDASRDKLKAAFVSKFADIDPDARAAEMFKAAIEAETYMDTKNRPPLPTVPAWRGEGTVRGSVRLKGRST